MNPTSISKAYFLYQANQFTNLIRYSHSIILNFAFAMKFIIPEDLLLAKIHFLSPWQDSHYSFQLKFGQTEVFNLFK